MEKELRLILEDFLERHSDDEIKKTYLSIYDDYDEAFQKVFAYFHQTLNTLFEFMNMKSHSNNHYNADESRLLTSTIEELRDFIKITNPTIYKIKINQGYIDVINYCKKFLESSGGSSIPDDFSEIKIEKFKPIFTISHKENLPRYTPKETNVEAKIIGAKISIILNKNVFNHVQQLLNDGHYFNAVEEAYKIVRQKLKDITGKEKAHEAFSDLNQEKLFGRKPLDEIEKDFFEGVKFLHMAIQKLRNEKAHTPAQPIDKNLAIHYIVLASLAYDLIANKGNR